MKKLLSLILVLIFALSLFSVGAFADEELSYTPYEEMPTAEKKGITLNVYNWGEYIANGTEDSLDVIAEFTRVTGIDVNYTTFETNEALYAKLVGGGANYDIIIPSDYMIAKMIKEDMLEPLNFENIPNYQFIDEAYKNTVYDPENLYSVPYTWSTVGLFYNKKYVEEVPKNWDALWDERYTGKILMFDNPRDAFAIAMSRLGYSYNSTNVDEWYQAADLLKQQKPILQAYVMDQVFNKMESGEAWLAPYYAGDAAILVEENEDIGFIMPEGQSANEFIDGMCIPKGSQHKAEAEAFINFMCNPDISAENCSYIGYATPISLSRDFMDEEIVNDPLYYPSEETLAKCEMFNDLPEDISLLLDELWAEVKMGGPGDTVTLIMILLVFLFAYVAAVVYKKRKRRKEI